MYETYRKVRTLHLAGHGLDRAIAMVADETGLTDSVVAGNYRACADEAFAAAQRVEAAIRAHQQTFTYVVGYETARHVIRAIYLAGSWLPYECFTLLPNGLVRITTPVMVTL